MVKSFRLLLILGLAGFVTEAWCQDVRVRGYFAADSAAVGEVIPYVLTASYPRDTQVLFPDSTFAFAPFEPAGKRFFPTRTADGRSHDSVVYRLSTFELDSLQSLRLPVFVVQAQDCLAVYSERDTIRLRFRVTIPLDSIPAEKLPLKANTAYQRVQQLFNYPILLITLGVLVLAAIVTWVVFGKRIRKYFLLRRMNRNYRIFVQRFGETLDRLGKEASTRIAEEALWTWKRYMEDLEDYPFTKSTSREIVRKYSNDQLAKALRVIDRGIYGGYGTTTDPFRFLQDYSRQQFEKREAEVKHG